MHLPITWHDGEEPTMDPPGRQSQDHRAAQQAAFHSGSRIGGPAMAHGW